MSKGYIYILQNPAFRSDLIKIGMTTRSVDERAKELSSNTSVPSPFEIACFFSVNNCIAIESLVHTRLDPYRWSKNREFFNVSLPVAYKIISEIILEHQDNTTVEQAVLNSISGTLTISSQNEINKTKTEIDEATVIWVEKRRLKNIEEQKNFGEEWVKRYVDIKNIELAQINQKMLRTDIEENVRAMLIRLKSFCEADLIRREKIIQQRDDLIKILKEIEGQL